MPRVLEHYNYLHTIPELGFSEIKTASYIAQKLKDAGFKVQENINQQTGIVAILEGAESGPTLALRADMDALGHIIDGKKCAIHSCGHDAHCAVLLSAAEDLIANKTVKKGQLRLLFQPAEELGTGALSMIKGGALDGVDMIIGAHLRPIQECAKGQAVAAMYYSASATLKVQFKGEAAHAARPHLGVNALDAGVCAINAINTIKLNPGMSYSVKATKLICDAGVTNSIPEIAEVYWDLRSEQNEVMGKLQQKVLNAIEHAAAGIGADVVSEFLNDIPAAEINDEMSAIISSAIVEVLGENGLKPSALTPGGEDFWFYTRHNPKLKAGFFGLGVDLKPGLHHPDMHFDLSALQNGVNIFKACVTKVLG